MVPASISLFFDQYSYGCDYEHTRTSFACRGHTSLPANSAQIPTTHSKTLLVDCAQTQTGDYQSTGMVADEAVHAHYTLPGKASLGLSDIQRNHAAQQWARLQHLAPQVPISISQYPGTAVCWRKAVSCLFFRSSCRRLSWTICLTFLP